MRSAALILPLAAMACVDGARPFTRSTREAVAYAKSTQAALDRERMLALPRVPEGQHYAQVLVGSEAGAPRVDHYLIGPLRADLRGAVSTVAEDVPEMPIVRAMRAARGWVFVTENGQVWASTTFTGRLRALHSFDCRREPQPRHADNLPEVGVTNDLGGVFAGARRRRPDDLGGLLAAPRPGDAPSIGAYPAIEVFEGRGRIVIAAPGGRSLYSTDGVTFSRVDIDDAMAMAFSSESRGAVIVGESLRTTRDGGRTWNAIDLGEQLPLMVEGRDEGLFVDTSEGMRRIGDDDSLTPAQPRGDGPTRTSRAPEFRRVFERGYARATMPTPRCAPLVLREDGYDVEPFVLGIPERTDRWGVRGWNIPRGASSPLGTPHGRAFAPNERMPAVASITRPDNPSPGHRVTLAWRGEDGLGSFSKRVETAAPPDVTAESRWRVIVAARAGLLVHIDVDRSLEDDERPIERRLYWFSDAGARRVAITLQESSSFSGLALDDGGAAVVTRTRHSGDVPARPRLSEPESPTVTCLLAIAPDGSTRARRCTLESARGRAFAGLGERDGSLGLAMTERPTETALTLLTLDGASRPFGTWSLSDTPAVCGAPSSTRLHLFSVDYDFSTQEASPFSIPIGPQFDGPPFAEPRLVTLEHAPSTGAQCIRRVWGTRREEDVRDANGDSVDDLWGAFRVTARNGRLVGNLDTGDRIATMPVTIDDDAPPEDI